MAFLSLESDYVMELITVSSAKAKFSKFSREVLRSRRPVVVRTPAGLVQIALYESPEVVEPAPGEASGVHGRK